MTFRAPPPVPDVPGPGRESVWDYPRPPRLERSDRLVEVRSGELTVATTRRAFRVLETSHPPGWYLPPEDVRAEMIRPAGITGTRCEFKGAATYWDVAAPDGSWLAAVAWSYPDPTPDFRAIADYLAFYPSDLQCQVDGQPVRAQDGRFYGGWVTDEVVGPFKGAPGSMYW